MSLQASASGSRLHLGCGGKAIAGYINTDGRPHLSPARFPLDVLKDELPEARFGEVYLSHVLEHVYKDLAPALLQRIHRALVPGGILRISVPDLRKVLTGCVLSQPGEPDYFGPEPDNPLFGPILSTTPEWDRHKRCFTAEILTRDLLQAGFVNIRHWRTVDVPEIHAVRDWASFETISLNLLGQRP